MMFSTPLTASRTVPEPGIASHTARAIWLAPSLIAFTTPLTIFFPISTPSLSAAVARSPCRAPLTVTSSKLVAPGAKFGRSQATSAANSRCPTGRVGVPQSKAGAASGSP